MAQTSLQLRFDAFELDEADARLKRDGKPVALAPKAFGVLCALARQPGQLVTKNALLDAVWGHQHVSESVLKTTISQVRAALADDASNPRFIETASRLGYRFIGSAKAPAASAVAVATAELPDSFIGRRAPLERLGEAWRRAAGGERRLVWVAGDAGVGKSTLIETFLAGSGAAAIAQGQCVEQHGSGEPYLPVLQALGGLTREYPGLAGVMRAVAPTWLIQLPWLVAEGERAALTRELVGVSQDRMVREFHELVSRFTEQQPLLFVIEDLHWSDQATLRLMDHFARQRGAARMLWLGTFRLTQIVAEGHALQGLRQELKLQRLCDEIVLDPFSETEVLEYLRGRMTGDTPEAFVRRVHAHTDGLPLFVVHVVEALVAPENDAVAARNAGAFPTSRPLPVPDDLAGAIEARIVKLPRDVISVLEVAAVNGVEFRAGAVAAALDRPLGEVVDACDGLARRQYLLRHTATVDLADGSLDAVYTFRHAMYRHVFYRRIGEAQRLQLHRRVAQALRAGAANGVPVAQAELALHHERGREFGLALVAYAEAAQAALRAFAPGEALEICEHARTLLAAVPAGPEKLALELAIESPRGISTAQLQGVGSPDSCAAFERVRELCELLPQHPARSLLLNGYGASLFSRGEYAKLRALAERIGAAENPERDPLAVMTFLFRAAASAARGECRVATDWWLKAIAVCESITERGGFQAFIVDPEVAVRSNSVRTLFERGLYDQAQRQANKAIEIADSLAQPIAQSLARWRAGMLAIRCDDPDAVLEHADAIANVVSKTSVVQGDGPSRYLRGWALARRGDPVAALPLLRDGLERHMGIGMIASCTEVMAYIVEALILARDFSGAEKQLGEAFARADELDERYYLPILLLLQARVAHEQGRAEAALGFLRQAVALANEQEAAGFELKARCALVEHAASDAADRAALAALLAMITEGQDSRDVRRARELVARA